VEVALDSPRWKPRSRFDGRALGASTLICGNGDGIHRSQDAGATWTKCRPRIRRRAFRVLSRRALFGGTNGLIVSRDLGESWQGQGTAVNIWQGPFFGRDEQKCWWWVRTGSSGQTTRARPGSQWPASSRRKATLCSARIGLVLRLDPVNNFLYASAMGIRSIASRCERRIMNPTSRSVALRYWLISFRRASHSRRGAGQEQGPIIADVLAASQPDDWRALGTRNRSTWSSLRPRRDWVGAGVRAGAGRHKRQMNEKRFETKLREGTLHAPSVRANVTRNGDWKCFPSFAERGRGFREFTPTLPSMA